MTGISFKAVSQYAKTVFITSLVMKSCISISAALIVLLSTDDDCANPVRTWLILESCIIPFLLLLSFKWEVASFILWTLWTIIWTIIGTFWVIVDTSCRDDFYYGYSAASIIISINYSMLAFIAFISCITGVSIFIGYGLMSNYESVD